jgi:uncharacterized caspase-like protein
MLHAVRFIALIGLIAGLALNPARAERRVALVIGNADYKVGPLQNPVNDAAAVADALGKLGFGEVILKKNLGADAFRAALLELSREASGADLGVVYFAGHGTEVGGKNYLIPIDARLARAGDLSLEAIALDSVLDQLAGVSRLKLVILDACHNNLFPLAGAKRSNTRGLTRIEPEDNTLVVYAAKDGTTADDGAGRKHSPFTEALLKHIGTPGLEVQLLFRRIRDEVMHATRREQQPHVYASLGAQEFYMQQTVIPATPPPVPKPKPPTVSVKSPTPAPTVAPKGTTAADNALPTSRPTKTKSRPDATEYSYKIWPRNSQLGSFGADTEHGRIECSTSGYRSCRWE